ncbi:MAG TPA: PRC-barrel domain-containing protein, partial [Gemmataceae bacterium]
MALRIRLLAAGLAAAALAGTANAQTEVRQTTTTTTSTTEVRKASVVLHSNVLVEGGASVGRIADFVLSDGGCIEYVVVDYDNKFVLVPYQVVRVDPAQRVVHVNVTREKFTQIPTFTGGNWPVHDQSYISRVNTVFGVRSSGYRGDVREGDRRPMDRGTDRRDDRRDNRGDRRDDRTQPPANQRPNTENPNRTDRTQPPPNTNPPATRPGEPNRNDRTQPPSDRPSTDRP